MRFFRYDDEDEISSHLNELVNFAEDQCEDKNYAPKIDIQDAYKFIRQYSPDSGVIKRAIFRNEKFCRYCGLPVLDDASQPKREASDTFDSPFSDEDLEQFDKAIQSEPCQTNEADLQAQSTPANHARHHDPMFFISAEPTHHYTMLSLLSVNSLDDVQEAQVPTHAELFDKRPETPAASPQFLEQKVKEKHLDPLDLEDHNDLENSTSAPEVMPKRQLEDLMDLRLNIMLQISEFVKKAHEEPACESLTY
tara:strand:- start:448 stop:1200 length:753 start_codon:yes stop_codon:yes gene_type:complete